MRPSTILIVEDNEMNERLLVRQLAHLGLTEVAVTRNGIAALDWLATHDCRLVIADCQMPEMDGYEMTRRIRAQEGPDGARLPIIALSAGDSAQDSRSSAAAGMDAHLAKPAHLSALRAVLEPWLGALATLPTPAQGPAKT